jgi:hypothetical protein
MRLVRHPGELVPKLKRAFDARRLWYGSASSYASLITPCTAQTDRSARDRWDHRADCVAELYRYATDLYLASVAGDAPPKYKTWTEAGHSPVEIDVHRVVASAALQPRTMRADCVGLSEDSPSIAEVQWKSGGPGFFYGHQDAYEDVLGPEPKPAPGSGLSERYLRTLADAAPDRRGTIVNEVRSEWLAGEHILSARAANMGVRYRPADRSTIAATLAVRSGGAVFVSPDGEETISVLRGRGYTERVDGNILRALVAMQLEGRLWLEAPPNLIYRQKWPLCLPFDDEHFAELPPILRDIVIPSVPVTADNWEPDRLLQHLDETVDGQRFERLEDVVRLPGSLRARIVVKCAAGSGPLQSGGRGVIKLSGSRSQVEARLAAVSPRIRSGEPWIAQPYVDAPFTAPLAHPEAPGIVREQEVRARVMVFSGWNGHRWEHHGALVNTACHWKVGGAAASVAPDGSLQGAAFFPVRTGGDPG